MFKYKAKQFHHRCHFFFLILFLLQACDQKTLSTIEIKDSWIRTPAPFAQALAGFMLLKNHSNRPIALVQVKAEGFEHIMLHQSMNKNGMHKMKHAENIVIPPQGELRFQHGGYHIMLMGIQKKIQSGDEIPLTLVFDNGLETLVSFVVKNSD